MQQILRSVPDNADELTELLYDSRSVWDYPKDYAEASKPLLRLTPSFIAENPVFHMLESNRPIAFYSFSRAEFGMELNNFWVAKDCIHKGIGKILWLHAIEEAIANGWRKFFILPDPGAEGFYIKMGAVRTGEVLPSRLPSGPRFQKLIYQLS